MPNETDLAMWRKSLAEIEYNIELLQRQYDALDPFDSVLCSTTKVTKRNMIADMIYELKIRSFDLIEWIKKLESDTEGKR